MKHILGVTTILALIVTTAYAQPQPQQLSLGETAWRMNNVINQWAQTIEELQKQNAQLQARVKELQDKYEPKDNK